MLKISSLIISLLLCFSAFSQTTKKEIMLEAHKLLEKYNWKEAEKLVLELAENGDVEAQYLMSKVIRIKMNGMSRKKGLEEEKKTWNWFRKANSHSWILDKNTSDEDSLRVQYVATIFNPERTDNDLIKIKIPNSSLFFERQKRLEITRKAAEKNIYDAQFVYSDLIRSTDSLESFKWLNRAADNGNMEALYSLGIMYSQGRLVKKDINKAIDYLSKSLEGGWYEATRVLGWMYYDGKEV